MAITHNDAPTAEMRQKRKIASRVDLATTKPGTPGGIFMRQFWHALYRSEDLPNGRAVPIRIMNEDYTLFRGASGRAQIIAEKCPHRGAMMHLGWVEDDTIRCVYHGWKYDCSGQCVEAPAEREGFERNVRIPVFPTGEAFGLIYGFFGNGEPPAFPPYPESHGEGFIEARPIEHVPCNYLQSWENSMDEVHVAFTHSPGGSHAILAHDLPLVSGEETPWGMLRFGKRTGDQVRHSLHIAPNAVRVVVPPASGLTGAPWPEITFHFTPVDDENQLFVRTAKYRMPASDIPAFLERRAELQAKREAAPPIEQVVQDVWAGRVVFAEMRHPELATLQDIAVQAGQGRITDREAETLGRSDAAIALWRRIMERELQIIADGGQPKKWDRLPDDVVPSLGV